MSPRRRGPSRPLPFVVLGLILLALTTAGCRKATPQVAPAETPVVPAANPVEREVTDYADFTGRTAAAKKSLEVYQLSLEFTKVKAPIDGQVSRYYLTLGNLVNQDQTLLTTVVSLDPMYAYFDMDERTLIQIRKAITVGQIMPYTP